MLFPAVESFAFASVFFVYAIAALFVNFSPLSVCVYLHLARLSLVWFGVFDFYFLSFSLFFKSLQETSYPKKANIIIII